MSRPTRLYIDSEALRHNLRHVSMCAPGRSIVAMVKANAYGCGLSSVVPVLEGHVDAFGVASLEEAMEIRTLGCRTLCVLFQGVFAPEELVIVAREGFLCVIHQATQLRWILENPLSTPIQISVKVNTGMNRLGFSSKDVPEVLGLLKTCPWVSDELGLMSHLASADEPNHPDNAKQWATFCQIDLGGVSVKRSMANSGAILSCPEMHADWVRPGIMLYGVSPFPDQTGQTLGLKPVMRLVSTISAIHPREPFTRIGYGGTWQRFEPSIIGMVPIGYGDGYPRFGEGGAPMVFVCGEKAAVVGRVSMDMISIDLTAIPSAKEGDAVELWGTQIPIETVAKSAGTIAYELMCQLTSRVRFND